jgi:hypothetical protein
VLVGPGDDHEVGLGFLDVSVVSFFHVNGFLVDLMCHLRALVNVQIYGSLKDILI